MDKKLIHEIKTQLMEAENFAKSIMLIETLLDVRNKNASDLSDEEFLNLIQYDPQLTDVHIINDETLASKPEGFSRWLLKMQKKGELRNVSHSQMQQILKSFGQLKNRKNLLPNNDINSYKTISDLENAVETAKQSMTANQKNKDAKRNQKELAGEKKPGMYMNGAVELLFNGSEWEVWTPHTYEGSKALRRGAVWCTGGDNDCYYNSYTKDGKLYVIINKNNKEDKYQLFVPNKDASKDREFKDKNNDTLKFREFVHNNNELLDFFMTQDIVLNSYEDLDNPNIDDEWSEEKENEVAYEYDLGYDDYTGEVVIYVTYNELLDERYYTTPSMWENFATNGYLEDYSEDYADDVINSKQFVNDINWSETELKVLHNAYQAKTKKKVDFNKFLYTLFGTEDGTLSDDDVHNWLAEMSVGNDYVYDVRNCISKYTLERGIEDFMYSQLRRLGWNLSDRGHNSKTYKYGIPYGLDVHTIQQFYEDIADNGHMSKSDILNRYNVYINESKGEIDPELEDFEMYIGNSYYEDDSSSIFDLFLTKAEYNEYLDYDESDDKELDNSVDKKIDEVLKIAGVK